MATLKKKTVVKKVGKSVKKAVAPKVEKAKTTKEIGLSATVVGVDGKAKGKIALPAELFDQKENKQLVAQAVRVYLANQREGGANTKTRGQVEGSTRKIYRQKGTGRARHGSIRAHIFVGGGIAFGPTTHSFSLTMPTKMKRMALASALSTQYHAGNVVFRDGLETLKPKTKNIAEAISTVSGDSRVLLVLAKDAKLVARSARNIQDVTSLPVSNLNTYDVLSHTKIIFMKDAVSLLRKNI
jgi:large subunit ribosomal protein L4